MTDRRACFDFEVDFSNATGTFYGLLIYMIFKGVKNPALKWTLISLLVVLIMIIGSSRLDSASTKLSTSYS